MERRRFLNEVSRWMAGFSIAPAMIQSEWWLDEIFLAENKLQKLTLLHTNDVHSHIDPFPDSHPVNPGKGGVVARAGLIQKIRESESNVLLVDAGDIFQGTPYFNFYGGELEFKLMTQMGYEVATLGNHDFDNGVEGLLRQLQHAGFEFVSTNYDFKDTLLQGKILPHKIMNKKGIKVGLLGLGIDLNGLVNEKLAGGVRYLDPVKIANDTAKFLKLDQKCDLVICLSHLGYNYKEDKISDAKLTSLVNNIDIIIGGHTHTFLTKAQLYKDASGKNIWVSQVGWAGLVLGRLDIVNKIGKNFANAHSTMYEIS